jgi:gas vesicle protein
MVAVLASYGVTSLLNLPQGYWAVFTTLIVMQGSVGGTVGASIDRLYGTVLGAAVGGFAAWARPQTPEGLALALVVACGLTGFIAAVRPKLRIAPVTAAILLLTATGKLGPFAAALDRTIEIGVGGVIGVLAALLIFPAKAQATVAARIRTTLDLLQQLLSHHADRLNRAHLTAGPDPVDLTPLHARLRAALAGVEAAMTDAERERNARLGDHRMSAALPRTLWRVRNDAVSIGRTLAKPWPEALSTRFGPGARAMLDAEIAFLAACDRALAQDTTVDRDGMDDAHASFQAALASFRQAHLTHDLTFDAIGGVFGLAFGLESLFGNLGDLADRIDESTLERSDRAAVGRRTKLAKI